MYAIITEDLLFDGQYIDSDRTNYVLIGEWLSCRLPDEGANLKKFRLSDDDGEVYYIGLADDDGLEYAFEWGMYDSGTTCLETFVPADGDNPAYWQAVIS